jgi:5'(3')-deoxyribonucleotidase
LSLRIAVDLDGVLANTIIPLCKSVNMRHSTHWEASSFVQWKAWETAHITKEEFFRTLDEAWFDWSTIPPTEEDIAEKLSRLREFGKVDLVTGRSPETVASARFWLTEQGIGFNSFVRTSSGMDKAKLNYDIFIDDSPDLMSLLTSSRDRHGILYTQPWNKNSPRMPRISRVSCWNEIPEVVRGILMSKT